jgi:hypothetical protein
MVGLNRIDYGKVRQGIKRVNWESGGVYEKYDHANTNLGTGNGFYVLAGTTDRDVYKCLDNNDFLPSSVKPSHKNLNNSEEVDGYVWKYMYTITDADFSQFATSGILPIGSQPGVSLSAEDGSVTRVTIAANSTSGTGRYYRGTGYSNSSASVISNGTIFTEVTGSTPVTSLVLAADDGLLSSDDYFNNSAFQVTSGRSAGTIRTITDWVNSTNTVTLDTGLINVSNGDTFIIGPKVTLTGDDSGSGFLGIGEVNSYGNLVNIIVGSSGSGYTNSNIAVSIETNYASGVAGAGAVANVYISPMGGHGKSIQSELNAKYVIVSAETTIANIDDEESGTSIGPQNQIRQVGLIRNPEIQTQIVSSPSYDLRTNFYLAHPTPTMGSTYGIKQDALLTNANTGGVARVWSIAGTSGKQYITVVNVRGSFTDGDWVYAGDQYVQLSSANLAYHEYPSGSQYPPSEAVQSGMITKYSGDIMYHENISEVSRYDGQKENFKFIFEF